MVRMLDVDADAVRKKTMTEDEVRCKEEDLDVRLSSLLTDNGDPPVQAYALLTLEACGDVACHISKDVKPYVDTPMLDLAGTNLRQAYETLVHRNFIRDEVTPNNPEDGRLTVDETATGSTNTSVVKYKTKRQPRGPSVKRGQSSRPDQPCGELLIEAADDATEESANDEPIPKARRMQSFFMSETNKVKDFLAKRIQEVHQLSDKKIAKAWIKGICPKKQARFPYHNKHREREHGLSPVIPAWWPSEDQCPFTEPDHINRYQRSALLLHLLRLRPTPLQLKAWNDDIGEPNKTFVNLGWTAFLKELAPIDTVDDVAPSCPERVEKRRRLLAEIYEVADLEETFTVCGADQQFQCLEDEKPATGKRSRDPCPPMPIANSADDRSLTLSRCSSPSRSRAASSKRPRLDSDSRVSAVHPRLVRHMSDFTITEETMTEPDESYPQMQNQEPSTEQIIAGPSREWEPRMVVDQKVTAGQSDTSQLSQTAGHSMIARWRAPWRTNTEQGQSQAVAQQHQQWQHCGPTPNNSFESSMSEQAQPFETYAAQMSGPSTFPGRHDYAFPQCTHQHQPQMVQVHQATQVPQPQFDTVPSTPMFSPTSLVYPHGIQHTGSQEIPAMPGSVQVPQQPFRFPGEYIDQSSAGPSQYDPQTYVMQQQGPVQRVGQALPSTYPSQGATMQYGGLPFNTPRRQVASDLNRASNVERGFATYNAGVRPVDQSHRR